MICKNCKNEFEGNFCPKCGTKAAATDTEHESPDSVEHEKNKHNSKNSKVNWIITGIASLLTVCLIVFLLGVFDVITLPFLSKDSAEDEASVTYDENNIGEVKYYQTDPEHVIEDENGRMYVDNEILLVAKDGVKYADIEKLAEQYEAEIVGWIQQTGDYQLKLNKNRTIEELEKIASSLKDCEPVLDAYINFVFNLKETKTEDRNGFIYGDNWEKDLQNFNNCEGKSWGLEAIGTFAAWDVLDSHKNEVKPVRVGLIDNAFDNNHEDLGFAEVFYNENKDCAHGTHVAGTMAAKANNNEGICGIYPYGDGNLYGVSHTGVCSYFENGDPFSTSMFLKIAYSELILRNVKVINSSLAFNYYLWKPALRYTAPEWNGQVEFLESNSYILGDFLNRLLDKGYDFVLVTAAGNDSDRANNVVYDSKYSFWTTVISEQDYPEVYNRIIVVGAVDSDFNICNFSNGGDRVDIYAPGDDIYSTVPDNKYDNTDWDGTSMAAPHVSGVAAMVWSANNDLTGAQIKEIICDTHSIRCVSCDMIDAYVALQKAVSTDGSAEIKSNIGGILGWVVSKKNENTKIENATVTVVNTESGEEFITETDNWGHFELFVPGGTYSITVKAENYEDYTSNDLITVTNNEVKYTDDWIKMEPIFTALSEEELLSIMEESAGHKIEEYVYADMDSDGANELIGVFAIDYVYNTWYCSSDGSICKKVHENNDFMEDCIIELLTLDGETHVALNAYRIMGTGKNYSILALRNNDITCILSNRYGYVSMTDEGDITLNVEDYDGYYDAASDMLMVHTWKNTYIYFDGKTYKEYGATEIKEEQYLMYKNSSEVKQAINEELSESEPSKIEYSYFIRANGIMHIQCSIYEKSGSILYKYYTLRYNGNTIVKDPDESTTGQMSNSFSSLDVTY